MKQPTPSRRSKALALVGAVCAAALFAAVAPPAFALKFAAVEHHLKVDPATPVWKPAAVQTEPEEELGLVGADDLISALLFRLLIHDGNFSTELNTVTGQVGDVDDLSQADLAFQLADACLDHALAVFGCVVFGILREITMLASFSNSLDYRWPFLVF